MFAPDLLAVVDVDVHERQSWVTEHEGKGLGFVLEVNVSGNRKKDFEDNVLRYARLQIPEYFAFDVQRARLVGWRLTGAGARAYEPIVHQAGCWESKVLELNLSLDGGKLRFLDGNAPLLDARELIIRLSAMVDDALRRAEDEARRAEKLAARLRQLGIDPDDENC